MAETTTLRDGFLRSLARFPDRPCFSLGEESLTYAAMDARARAVAATLDAYEPRPAVRLTAVFGHRHATAFAGLLGALFRGHGYVPLNPSFPLARSRAMLDRSGCGALVVDATATSKLTELLASFERPLVVVLPDLTDAEELAALRASLPEHRLLGAADLVPASVCTLGEVGPDDIAYLLFTSGSTGTPKGVMVAHRNVRAFLDVMVDRYAVTEHDRFSQTFDLTFDLSVFDTFCAFERGACVCVPTAQQKLFPGKYVKQQALTVWFSVPSTGVLMSRLRMLKPGSYPTLRWSLFCGEALPVDVVTQFAEAAPASIVENLYGPTELTIACTLYRWRGEASLPECAHGVVPIGEPYPGMRAIVVDESLRPVPAGEAGELLLTGPQVTPGYYRDAERTAKAFVVPAGETEVFYRTGDRVRAPSGGPLLYLGRVDHQVKIQGYRVELGEVESVLRELGSTEVAIAIGWPVTASGADGIVGFVQPRPGERAARAEAYARSLVDAAKGRLPSYMQPSRIVVVDAFPLNANGKVDRNALRALLEADARAAADAPRGEVA